MLLLLKVLLIAILKVAAFILAFSLMLFALRHFLMPALGLKDTEFERKWNAVLDEIIYFKH